MREVNSLVAAFDTPTGNEDDPIRITLDSTRKVLFSEKTPNAPIGGANGSHVPLHWAEFLEQIN